MRQKQFMDQGLPDENFDWNTGSFTKETTVKEPQYWTVSNHSAGREPEAKALFRGRGAVSPSQITTLDVSKSGISSNRYLETPGIF